MVARYPTKWGEGIVRKRYKPPLEYTNGQGEGRFAVVDGQICQIDWPHHDLPHQPNGWVFSDEEIMGERPF